MFLFFVFFVTFMDISYYAIVPTPKRHVGTSMERGVKDYCKAVACGDGYRGDACDKFSPRNQSQTKSSGCPSSVKD